MKRKESLFSGKNLWAYYHYFLLVLRYSLGLITKPYVTLTQYLKTRTHQISGVAALNLQRDLWAKFTSKYLHLLVDRILNLPPSSGADIRYPIKNIYHTTLKFTDHAYLARFMTSTHPIAEGAF